MKRKIHFIFLNESQIQLYQKLVNLLDPVQLNQTNHFELFDVIIY